MKVKTKRTRLWSLLLALVMVAALLPTTVLAAEPAAADFTADPGAALALLNAAKTGEVDSTWDGGTNTLTLNGVNFATSVPTAVKLPAGAKIVLNGANAITGGDAASSDCHGIYAQGDLTIVGTGTLAVTSGNSKEQTCYGIYAHTNLIIAATVTATGGSAGYYSFGVVGQDSVGVSGAITATGGTAYAGSYGLAAVNYVSISGIATTAGGTSEYDSHGINVNKDIYISGTAKVITTGGTVTPVEDSGYYGSYGIAAGNDVTVSGTAQVIATGSTANAAAADVLGSLGILANKNIIISESGQVTVAGGDGSLSSIEGSVSTGGQTVSFDANGGTGYMEAITGTPTYILPTNGFAAPEGKLFKCWNINGAEQAVGAAVDVAANPTITAVWACAVSFDANGGTGEMAAQAVVPGDYALPENGFTAPEGKRFKCWSVDGAEQAVGTVIQIATNTTVTAVWEDNAYTVSFDANGGTGEMAAVPGVLGEYPLPENGFTAPEGKRFKGWATSADGVAIIADASLAVAADTTLYAVWEDVTTEYEILDGADSNRTQDSNGSLSIRGSGAFSDFVGVNVDGVRIGAKNYTVEEGSTVVTLNADYLNTFAEGSHYIELVWSNGFAGTTFTVHAPAADSDAQSSQTDGDNGMGFWTTLFFVWLALVLVFSGAVIFGIVFYVKKKKKQMK